ncbi:MAG TPA: DUF6582 domain-containing protein [Jiangellales bacterium]|nr:DUF6582 domain-containing protein [Jiangellales bacterium]
MANQRRRSGGLSSAARTAMPASEFAFPRLRKEPLNDRTHVRNAIARFDQVREVSDSERDEAFKRIKKAANRFGINMTEQSWQELGKPSATMKSSDKPRGPTKAELYRSGGGQLRRAELYAEATRRNVRGRSTMTKAELQQALRG